MSNRKNFLCLARRDKSSVKILAMMGGEPRTCRLSSTDQIRANEKALSKIQSIYSPNRLLWEMIIEQADDFTDLLARLRSKGYGSLPSNGSPLVEGEGAILPNSTCPKARNTMLRKGNPSRNGSKP